MRRASEYDLDELFAEYFGSADSSDRIQTASLRRLQADFDEEADRGRRLALWLVLTMVGEAPGIGAAFTKRADRITARTLAEILAIDGRASASRRHCSVPRAQ